jgi:hypothetical protein
MEATFLRHHHALRGSTTLVVLSFITTISVIFGAILSRSMDNRRNVSQISTWQEALLAAESGGEMALAELRRTLFESSAFVGWQKISPEGVLQDTVGTGAGKAMIDHLLKGGGLRYAAPSITHGGEGCNEMGIVVTIDAPPQLIDPSKRQWFRVRSTGTTYLPGAIALAGDRRDHQLRKLSMVWDPKTKSAVTRPQTSRTIELVIKPIGLEPAIFSRLPIDMNNANIVVDSYDSRDSTQSTNGLYDPAKRTAEGDVATNSTLIDAGNAFIYGDAFTNGGTVENGANVQGEIDNEYELEVDSILKPTWPQLPASGGYAISSMGGGSTVFGGTEATPKRYKLMGNGSLNITGGDIIFEPDPVEKLAGRESFAEVWVPGDMKTAGTAGIIVKPGMNVKIYVEGSIYIGGNGNWNANSQPQRLQVFGVKYTGTGQPPAVTIAGNGIIVAAIYTPDHPVEFKATGSGGQMWGCIFGQSIIMGGSTHIHYDRALADVTKITDFRTKHWYEDHQ